MCLRSVRLRQGGPPVGPGLRSSRLLACRPSPDPVRMVDHPGRSLLACSTPPPHGLPIFAALGPLLIHLAARKQQLAERAHTLVAWTYIDVFFAALLTTLPTLSTLLPLQPSQRLSVHCILRALSVRGFRPLTTPDPSGNQLSVPGTAPQPDPLGCCIRVRAVKEHAQSSVAPESSNTTAHSRQRSQRPRVRP